MFTMAFKLLELFLILGTIFNILVSFHGIFACRAIASFLGAISGSFLVFFPFFLYLNSCLQLVHQELGKKVNWIQYNSAAPLKLIEWVVRMKILTPFSTKFIPLYITNRKDHYSQIHNLCSCEKKAWKTSGLRGFQPWSLWYHCRTLINWGSKLMGSWICTVIFREL